MKLSKISTVLWIITQSTNIQSSTPRSFTNYSIQSDAQSSLSSNSVGAHTLNSNQSIFSVEAQPEKKQILKKVSDLSIIKNIQVAQKTFSAFKKKYNPVAYLQTESGKNSEYCRYLQLMYNLSALESIKSIVLSCNDQATKRQTHRFLAMKRKQTELVAQLLANLELLQNTNT
jgi:hypothetical protein